MTDLIRFPDIVIHTDDGAANEPTVAHTLTIDDVEFAYAIDGPVTITAHLDGMVIVNVPIIAGSVNFEPRPEGEHDG